MQVKMIACMSGVDHVLNSGDVCEMEDDEAARCIEAGFCEPATEADKKAADKAAKAAADTAAKEAKAAVKVEVETATEKE